jgi:hypothetical protein
MDLRPSKKAKTTNDTDQVQLELGIPEGKSHSREEQRSLQTL